MHKSLVGLTISNIKYFLHNEICLKEFCDDYEHQNQKMSTLIFEMQSTLWPNNKAITAIVLSPWV
jgi:hypothetical protein